jgi:ESS family glutamate:Na+ symporter
MNITLNIVESAAIAVGVLFLGVFLRNKVKLFQKFCIPSPVIGGLLVSIVILIGHITNTFYVEFGTAEQPLSELQNLFMLAFFTTVGYGASFRLVKKGSRDLVVLIILIGILIICQDAIAVAIAPLFDLDPLLGLCTGSISMVGGHGTSLAWGPILEADGIAGATTVAVAAATFGLVAGSLIGGPIGKKLVERHKLLQKKSSIDEVEEAEGVERGQEVGHQADVGG